jgi:hypothetical protein
MAQKPRGTTHNESESAIIDQSQWLERQGWSFRGITRPVLAGIAAILKRSMPANNIAFGFAH